MKMMKSFWMVLAFISVACSACSQDKVSEPEGAVTINMLDELNGKTLLGNSDVYINAANNFRTSSCLMMDLGRKSGLGAISYPVLNVLSGEMAVEPGHGYFVCKSRAVMEFESGELALPISSEVDYYKVYVASAIEKEGKTVGALVRYSVDRPKTYGLPPYDTTVGTIRWDLANYNGNAITIKLSDSDFEYNLEGDGDLVKASKQGRSLQIAYNGTTSEPGETEHTLYLRIKSSYTCVKVVVIRQY